MSHLAFTKLTIRQTLVILQLRYTKFKATKQASCAQHKVQKQGEFLRHKRHKSAQKYGKNLA